MVVCRPESPPNHSGGLDEGTAVEEIESYVALSLPVLFPPILFISTLQLCSPLLSQAVLCIPGQSQGGRKEGIMFSACFYYHIYNSSYPVPFHSHLHLRRKPLRRWMIFWKVTWASVTQSWVRSLSSFYRSIVNSFLKVTFKRELG